MTIKEILIEKQLEAYIKLLWLKRSLGPQSITERDIKECMRQNAYKRGKGGALRQIRR